MLSSTVNGMAKKAQPIGQTKPRIGRPRASANETDQPVAEESLAVARRLFREKGFAGTSTREIADAALLLAESDFITGTVINVDGGHVAGHAIN